MSAKINFSSINCLFSGEVVTIVGSARQNSETGEGKLLVNFPTAGTGK